MTALACCLQDMGIKVEGSDIEEVFVTDEILKKRRIKWKEGFSEKNLPSFFDLVVTTGAHGGLNNPEVVAAKKRNIPVLTHAECLGKLMEGKKGISVCGVGGKTTTSSMIAAVLEKGGRKPSWVIGVAKINPLGFGGRWQEGEELVAEADEYVNSPGVDNRPRFIFQNPLVIVVTNIEYDHPDVYENLGETKRAFFNFFKKLPPSGLLLGCADNKNNLEVGKKFKKIFETYGFSPLADWQIEKLKWLEEEIIFNLNYHGRRIENIKIKVPGRYNVLNATAAFATGAFFGLSEEKIKKGLAAFGGTRRRFEFLGEAKGVRVYDDYAHHPSEIKQVIAAAKRWFPKRRLVVVFQPHTYSRTKFLLKDFSLSFNKADLVVISEIYASAREKDDLGISGEVLAKKTAKNHPAVFFKKGEEEVIDFLKNELKKNDIVLTLGAGSIFSWGKNILKSLKS